MTATAGPALTKKDFVSNQVVRWCPGCGDYAILNSAQHVFAELGIPRERIVIVSGIGCSSRFPYYVESYGFHTIHGRAPGLATGLKVARPELSVWVVTGDGDGLSIGGNHLIHALRRNVDLKILLFNNRIYGLTKGQTSPTSEFGKKTKSTPAGSVDRPVNPIRIALAAEATLVARSVDVFNEHLRKTLHRAAEHRGSAFVEIFQNCNIFNDGAWVGITERDRRDDQILFLEHGKPMRFGKELEKGIRLRGLRPEVVRIGEAGVTEAELLVHDEADPSLAYLLSRLGPPEFPTPMGVFHRASVPSYEENIARQLAEAKAKQGDGDLLRLIHSGDVWEVKG
ncbi:MAG: 2-oxoacid:ferredoxin oxidoreductase subunit beta [Planctomycetota bacterium]